MNMNISTTISITISFNITQLLN